MPPRGWPNRHLPRGSVGFVDTEVLLAILSSEWPSYTAICERTGLNRNSVFQAIQRLREAGLVTMVSGRKGTMRAAVRPVAVLP